MGRVYGPVPSRRFGLSLGVDLVPHKVCCYDCVYCQVGRTTEKTVARRDFYPVDAIAAEIERALVEGPPADVITLAGSGEPTLYRSLGTLVARIRGLTDRPIVLLTGGATLMCDDVATDVVTVDVLAPSLDAGTPAQFTAINRPDPGIAFEDMVEGMRSVVEAFSGTVRLEVMLLPGLNDSPSSMERIAGYVRGMGPVLVDLNTPVRSPQGKGIVVASARMLDRAATLFGPTSTVIGAFEVSEDHAGSPPQTEAGIEALVLETLARRPCTVRDLAVSLSGNRRRVLDVLDRLLRAGFVEERRSRNESYFWAPAGRGVDDDGQVQPEPADPCDV